MKYEYYKEVNLARLETEIRSSYLDSKLESINLFGNDLVVNTLGSLSIQEKIDLDNIINIHESYSLDDRKIDRIKEIDNKTQSLVFEGFTHDSKRFSLSALAQINWIGLKQADENGLISFPMEVTTIDDKGYELQDSDEVTAFYIAALGYKMYILDGGRSLKKNINDAATIDELDSIMDNR